MKAHETANRKPVGSVQKALQILECFDVDHPELSLMQLSAMTGFPKTTVFGLAYTLMDEDYLEKSSGGFRLGVRLMEKGYLLRRALPITSIAAPLLTRLCRDTGFNAFLTTHTQGELLYIQNCYAELERSLYPVAGKRTWLHCTASGKAMMSQMVSVEVNRILEKHGMPAKTPDTMTDPEQLFRQLAEIRRQGYALDDGEDLTGSSCVAVSILNHQGLPVGAVSVSGPTADIKRTSLMELVNRLNSVRQQLASSADLFPCRFLT